MPDALIAISSASGTRADTLPLVQATSPFETSSACSAQTSRRIAWASAMRDLPRAQVAQPVHDVVAAAAEVVVQALVVLIQRVVGVGAACVRHERRAHDAAHRRGGGADVGVHAGGDR